MNYRAVIDPNLTLSTEEFVSHWNQSDAGKANPASLMSDPSKTFLSPELTVAAIAVAVSIPAQVIANLVSDYLKQKFAPKPAPKITTTEVRNPDGSLLLIVKRSES